MIRKSISSFVALMCLSSAYASPGDTHELMRGLDFAKAVIESDEEVLIDFLGVDIDAEEARLIESKNVATEIIGRMEVGEDSRLVSVEIGHSDGVLIVRFIGEKENEVIAEWAVVHRLVLEGEVFQWAGSSYSESEPGTPVKKSSPEDAVESVKTTHP